MFHFKRRQLLKKIIAYFDKSIKKYLEKKTLIVPLMHKMYKMLRFTETSHAVFRSN